jgi:hypothetical protein
MKRIFFLIPLLYLALLVGLEPADQLGEPTFAPFLDRSLYDDYDLTAYIVRALNADQGRTPGLPEPPGPMRTEAFNEALKQRDAPADSPWFLEYPPAAVWLFRLPLWLHIWPSELKPPAAILDSCHNDVVEHQPQEDAERNLWRTLRRCLQFYQAAAILALLLLMVLVHRGYEPGGRLSGPAWLLVLPATLYFTANRFDIVPAVLMGASFFCLGRERVAASAFLLGAATLVKVYPVLVAVLFIRYLSNDLRKAALWTTLYGLTLIGCLLPPLSQWGWEATVAPYRYQLSRPLEEVLTFYNRILPYSFGEDTFRGKTFRIGTLLGTLGLLILYRPADLASLLRRTTVLLAVFVSLLVFYSPQWIVWFTPLLVPLAGLHRPILILTVALDLVTYVTFPLVFDLSGEYHKAGLLNVLVYMRAGILGGISVVLLWTEFGIHRTPKQDRGKGEE